MREEDLTGVYGVASDRELTNSVQDGMPRRITIRKAPLTFRDPQAYRAYKRRYPGSPARLATASPKAPQAATSVRQIVTTRVMPTLKAAFDIAKRHLPRSGKIVVQFKVDPQGEVSEISTTEDSLHLPQVTRVAIRMIANQRFPGGSGVHSFPFVFLA